MSHVNNGFKGYQYYEFNYIKVICSSYVGECKKTFQLKDLAGHGKEEAIEEEKKKKVKPDAASFPTEGKTEEEEKKKGENLFFFNETDLKDEKRNSGEKGGTSEQAGSLSNLLDLNNPQVRKSSTNDLRIIIVV